MPSSTSSSDSSSEANARSTSLPRALGLALAAAWPTILVAAALIAAAGFVDRARTAGLANDEIESIIVNAQVRRAHEASAADVLVIGDSTGLMGVDPVLVGSLAGPMGARIESLATLGFVGPAGYGALLRAWGARAHAPSTLLLVMNGASLALEESVFAVNDYEAAVIGAQFPPHSFAFHAKRALFQAVLAVAPIPLAGSFGRYYGNRADLADAIARGHGGIVDPNEYVPKAHAPPFRFALSPAVAARLPALRDAIVGLHAARVLVAVTPLPEDLCDAETAATRRAVSADLLAALGLPDGALLALPACLPARLFATTTHLNATGRETYSREVIALLRAPSGADP